MGHDQSGRGTGPRRECRHTPKWWRESAGEPLNPSHHWPRPRRDRRRPARRRRYRRPETSRRDTASALASAISCSSDCSALAAKVAERACTTRRGSLEELPLRRRRALLDRRGACGQRLEIRQAIPHDGDLGFARVPMPDERHDRIGQHHADGHDKGPADHHPAFALAHCLTARHHGLAQLAG